MKSQIVRCFNRGASTYHLANDLQSDVALELAKKLPLHLPHSVLEIGSGTGLFSQYLVSAYPQAKILLTDIASSMLDICKRSYAPFTNVDTLQLDGEKIPETHSYDLIVSNMTLHWFNEINESLKTILERLTPNGKCLFSMVGKNSFGEWHDILEKHQLPMGTPFFPCHLALQKKFPEMQFEVQTIQKTYDHLFHFLNSLKKLGATATRKNYSGLPRAALKDLLRKYASPIKISYEIIYGVLNK